METQCFVVWIQCVMKVNSGSKMCTRTRFSETVHVNLFAWNERVNHILRFAWKGLLKFVMCIVSFKKSNFRCLFRRSIYKKRNIFIFRNWWENKRKKNFKICNLHLNWQNTSNRESKDVLSNHNLPLYDFFFLRYSILVSRLYRNGDGEMHNIYFTHHTYMFQPPQHSHNQAVHRITERKLCT